jgi:acyl-coenzyme A thioesterase 13
MDTAIPTKNISPELAHAKKISEDKMPSSPIYQWVLDGVKLIDGSKGRLVARLPLSEKHMNSKNTMHGSLSLTIIDWLGGIAITTCDFRTSTGVSLDIHVSYQSTAALGEEIEMEGVVERLGRSVAFTKVNIYRVEGGVRSTLLVTGSHTKYVK